MALILCDVDGTLVSGEGNASAYGDSMAEAIFRIHHESVSVNLDEFHGFTDRLVMKEIFRRYDVLYDDSSLNSCLRLFGEIYPERPEGLVAIPGVLETIPELSEGNLLGLLTGNVERMARKKLRLFFANNVQLSSYFLFGGFGGTDPHETRADLIPIAIQKARQYGWTGENEQTFVIDDSPRGLTAAIEAGVIPIGITTGIYKERGQLEQTGTEYIVDNFREIPNLLRRLTQ